MTKSLKTIFLLAICTAFTLIANAQKTIKEGTAIYTVEYDLPPDQQSMAGMLPKEFKVSFKGEYSQFKMDMGMFATKVILNNITNETLSLMDIPTQNKKIAVKMNAEEAKKMQGQSGEQDFEVTPTTKTKKIAGYNCTKYLMKDKDSDTDSEIWATTEINIPANSLSSKIKGVKGVPVAFSSNAGGMNTILTLKSITEESVSNISFTIPAGYELMDFDALMGQMGR